MKQIVLDCEIYQNYFLLAFKDIATGKSKSYELYDGSDPFPVDEVMRIMEGCETVSDTIRNHKDISLVPYMIRSPFCGWKGTISFGILVNLP